jgi:acetyl-CoA synthetase
MMIFTSADHRIGRFDVESVVMEHQPVAEVGWSANPDPQPAEIVKASMLLRPGTDGSDALTAEDPHTFPCASRSTLTLAK